MSTSSELYGYEIELDVPSEPVVVTAYESDDLELPRFPAPFAEPAP
jgi:hypothetical protein